MPKCDFYEVEITLLHGCSPVNLLQIFSTPFPKNSSEELVLDELLLQNEKAFFQKRRVLRRASTYKAW